jgi:hypothetical protein
MRFSERTLWAGALLLLAGLVFMSQEPQSMAMPGNSALVKYHDDSAAWYANPAGQMIFFAVLEGLYTDGVSNENVDLIIPKGRFGDHFVDCCPLCHPAYEAFRLYRQRSDFYGLKIAKNAFGPNTANAKAYEELHSGDRAVRLRAIEGLIQGWVARRFSSLKLRDAERSRVMELMEIGRKRGMEALQQKNDPSWPLKGCAICDGSVEGCRLAPGPKP